MLILYTVILLLQAVYEGSQSEGMAPGTSILVVIATDADQTGTPNAEVEYSLRGGDINSFSIDGVTGVISNTVVLVGLVCRATQYVLYLDRPYVWKSA